MEGCAFLGQHLLPLPVITAVLLSVVPSLRVQPEEIHGSLLVFLSVVLSLAVL